jgi:hypothetical protein
MSDIARGKLPEDPLVLSSPWSLRLDRIADTSIAAAITNAAAIRMSGELTRLCTSHHVIRYPAQILSTLPSWNLDRDHTAHPTPTSANIPGFRGNFLLSTTVSTTILAAFAQVCANSYNVHKLLKARKPRPAEPEPFDVWLARAAQNVLPIHPLSDDEYLERLEKQKERIDTRMGEIDREELAILARAPGGFDPEA